MAKTKSTTKKDLDALKKALTAGGPTVGFPLKLENLDPLLLGEPITYKAEHLKLWKSLGAKVDLVVKGGGQVEDEEGLLTKLGMEVAHKYAKKWIDANARDLELERTYPDLAGLFFDIRSDADLARMHAV